MVTFQTSLIPRTKGYSENWWTTNYSSTLHPINGLEFQISEALIEELLTFLNLVGWNLAEILLKSWLKSCWNLAEILLKSWNLTSSSLFFHFLFLSVHFNFLVIMRLEISGNLLESRNLIWIFSLVISLPDSEFLPYMQPIPFCLHCYKSLGMRIWTKTNIYPTGWC